MKGFKGFDRSLKSPPRLSASVQSCDWPNNATDETGVSLPFIRDDLRGIVDLYVMRNIQEKPDFLAGGIDVSR